MQLGDLAEIPVIGVVFAVIAFVILAVVLLVLLPFLALALAEALVLAVLLGFGLVAVTLFGRPILVRARSGDGRLHLVWAVRGWKASRAVRDQVRDVIDAGVDPTTPGRIQAELIADIREQPRPESTG